MKKILYIVVTLLVIGFVLPLSAALASTVIDIDVAASGDDGYRYNTLFNNVATSIKVGNDSIGSDYTFDGYYRFLGVTIPQGATIDDAYISLYEYFSTGAGIKTRVFAEDSADPAAPANSADLQGRAVTTAYTDSDGDPGAAGWYNIDITAIIQELVNNYDYSNEAILILHKDNGSTTGSDNFRQSYSFDTAGYAPKIHIEYTAGAGVVVPTVTTDNSTAVEETTATLSGNITATGGENSDERGFQWGTSGVYTDNETDTGNFTAGVFSLAATGLPPGDIVYWRTFARNSAGYGYGAELTLETKPEAPTGLTDTDRTSTQINLSWTPGAGAENTTVRYRTDAYPTDYNDGTLAYNGTATTGNVTGLAPGQIYYFRAWDISTDNQTIYSDSYAQDTAYTLPANPTGLTLSGVTCNSLDADWTKGTGGDKTIITWKTGDYPLDYMEGTQAYFDAGNSTSFAVAPPGTEIFVRAWSYDSDSGYYSSGYSEDSIVTLAASDPTMTTENATLITDTTARLNGTISGLDCADAGDTWWEWGTATGVYTANFTDATDHGNGAVYHDISGLTPETEYFFRAAARLAGGAYQYGAELSFNTTAASAAFSGPTGFTLTRLTDTNILAEWNAVDNVSGYLLLVSDVEYPDDPFGLFAVAYNGTDTSVHLAGYHMEFTRYYFSLWAYRPFVYSDNYSTAEIGGNEISELASSFSSFGASLITIIITIVFLVIALWRGSWIFYVAAGFGWIILGFNLWSTNSALSVLAAIVGLACFAGSKFDNRLS